MYKIFDLLAGSSRIRDYGFNHNDDGANFYLPEFLDFTVTQYMGGEWGSLSTLKKFALLILK